MKCYLVINPKSRGGKAFRHFEDIFRWMEEEDLQFDHVFASNYESMQSATAYAHSRDYDSIVAVGGDGTINAVINGFFDEHGELRSEKRLGIIYTGTSPDFCKSYGVSMSPRDAVRALANGTTRSLRTGTVSFFEDTERQEEKVRYFACCASVGIGAMVASRANRMRKYLGDVPGTLSAILASLARFHPGSLTLITPEDSRRIASVTNVFVGRTKYIASGIKACQEMGPDDPRFYVITVRNLRFSNLLQLFRQIYSGNIRDSEVTQVAYSDHLQVVPDGTSYEIEFDGDPVGYAPCTFLPSRHSLRLICSSS